jgi:TRAP-type C4-dicarboxylate transport system substrate-binding protein
MTTSTKAINAPADLRGFKMRVPPSPISLSMFKDLGAAPMTLNAAEMYTGLQTHLADGEENPLGTIEANKLYEVQKYCSMTSHMWVGYWILTNGPAWKAMPAKLQDTVAEAFDSEAPLERADVEALNNSLVPRLQSQGMTFNYPDRGAFREALVQAGFYKQWQGNLGPGLWTALEKYSGPLG